MNILTIADLVVCVGIWLYAAHSFRRLNADLQVARQLLSHAQEG